MAVKSIVINTYGRTGAEKSEVVVVDNMQSNQLVQLSIGEASAIVYAPDLVAAIGAMIRVVPAAAVK